MMWSEVGIERKRGVLLCVFGVQDMLSSENTTAELIGVVTGFLKAFACCSVSTCHNLAVMTSYHLTRLCLSLLSPSIRLATQPSSSDCLMYSDR